MATSGSRSSWTCRRCRKAEAAFRRCTPVKRHAAPLFEGLRDPAVHEWISLGNDASCRVLERAGFLRKRVIPGNDRVRGALVDDIEYVRR